MPVSCERERCKGRYPHQDRPTRREKICTCANRRVHWSDRPTVKTSSSFFYGSARYHIIVYLTHQRQHPCLSGFTSPRHGVAPLSCWCSRPTNARGAAWLGGRLSGRLHKRRFQNFGAACPQRIFQDNSRTFLARPASLERLCVNHFLVSFERKIGVSALGCIRPRSCRPRRTRPHTSQPLPPVSVRNNSPEPNSCCELSFSPSRIPSPARKRPHTQHHEDLLLRCCWPRRRGSRAPLCSGHRRHCTGEEHPDRDSCVRLP